MKNLVFFALTLILSINISYSTTPDTLDFTVVATSGLSLRTGPYQEADRLEVLPYGTEVKTIGRWEEVYANDLMDTIDSRVGYWIETEHQGKKGYLFSGYLKTGALYVPATEINNNFRITVPGERCQAINYDAELHWYGIYIDTETGEQKVKAADILIEQAQDFLPVEEMAYADVGDFLNIKAAQKDSFLVFFGTKEAIDTDNIPFEKSYFNNLEIEHWDTQGKFIYPYERLQIAQIDHFRYFLTGAEQIKTEKNEMTGENFTRRYSIHLSPNADVFNLNEENSCDLSEEIGTNHLYQYHYATYLGPRIVWQGDINNDGFPDVLFYTPYMSECCGGSISYHLLISEKVNGKWQLKKAAQDEVYSCYGC